MLAIRRALINDPKPLMPDEPGLGLAPAVIDALYEPLREHSACGAGRRNGPRRGAPCLCASSEPERFVRAGTPNRAGSGGAANLPRVQRRGAIVTADCRAKNVPTTGSISEVILT